MTITFYKWTVLPPPIFTECTSASQSHSSTSAVPDVLQKETTTFPIGHPVGQI